MIFLMFVFGFLCGIVMATAFYAFLVEPRPRPYLHDKWEPTTTPLPIIQDTQAMKLPTGDLLRDWHSRTNQKEDAWLL